MQDQGNSSPDQPGNISRRRFIRRAATLALGGSAALSWLAACGDTATTVATNPTPAPTVTTAPVTTSAPATTAAAPLATTSPAAAATNAATNAPVVPPTATVMPTPVPPTPTPAPRPVNFIVFGDIRTAGLKPPPIFDKFVGLAKDKKPEAILMVGDIINADDDNSFVKKQWAAVKEAIKPLGNVPVFPAIGNHETNYRQGALPLYQEAWPELPKSALPSLNALVYSVDIGNVHLAVLANELPDDPHRFGKAQLDWLEKDLAANKMPFTLVMAHDPAHPVGPHVGSSLDVYPAERDSFWKLLAKYQVAAYLCGHEHLYQNKMKDGARQLIIGTTGSAIYGGYGGDFYHYAYFDQNGGRLIAHIIDENGKERDQLAFSPVQ